jgi:hypothetical protein
MIQKLLSIAQGELGVRESGGNNCGPRIREYQTAVEGLDPGPWAWCAAFVDWCVREWLRDPLAAAWLNLQTMTPEGWRPKTTMAYGFYGWSKERPNTTLLLTETADVQPGDIVMFDFPHVGLVESEDKKSGTIQTLEGNTNVAGERDSTTGDGVWRKTRRKSLARHFIRIRPRK